MESSSLKWLKILGVLVVVGFAGFWLYNNTSFLTNLSGGDSRSLLGAPAAVGDNQGILGYSEPGTTFDESNRNALSAFPFTMKEDGTARSVSVYIGNAEAGSQYSLAIYSDSGGNPSSLIANIGNQPVSATGWHSASINAALKANTTYWLVYNTVHQASGKNVLSYTTGTGAYKWHLQAFGNWPSTFGSVDGSASNVIPSLYVVYDKAVAATGTPPPTTAFFVGAKIAVSQGPINIRDRANKNGRLLGTQPTGATGTVVQGPVNNGGLIWWKVDYDTGVDGWTTAAYQYVVGGSNVSVPFDFSLTGGTSVAIKAGETKTQVVTVTKTAGTTAAEVSLSVAGAPTGLLASLSPVKCTPTTTCTSTLTLVAADTIATQSATVKVSGVAGSITKETNFAVSATAAPIAFDYSITTDGAKSVEQGKSVSSVITVTTLAGAAEAVTVSASGLPTGVTTAASTCTPTSGSCTVNLTLTASASATVGTANITVTGAAGTKIKTASFSLAITAPVVVPTGKFKIGDRIMVTGDALNVRSDTIIDPTTLLGQQNTGALGTVVDGPKSAGGLTWWKIDYDSGVDGWNTENYITWASDTPPPVNILNFNLNNLSPANLTQGSTVSIPVVLNITDSNAVQTITFAAGGLPTGVSAAFNPISCTSLVSGASTCNVSLGLAALGSASTGSYTATITANGGGKTSSVQLPLAVAAGQIINPPSTTFSAGDKVEVKPGTGTLNIRSGPGSTYGILGTRSDGATGLVQADANSGILADGNYWWKVDFSGLVGWAAEAFLRLFQDVVPILPPADGNTVPVGAGLEFPWDTMRSKMFADVIYSARPFETSSLDANGWPQSDFVVKVMTESADVPNGAHRIDATGVFTLAFEGRADVGVVLGSASCPTGKVCDAAYNSGRVYYDSATNQSVANVTFAPSVDSTWTYALNFTNTKRTPTSALKSGVTNIRLIRPGHAIVDSVTGEYKAKQKFSQEFLADIAPLQTLRLMDYMETNLVWADGDVDARIATLGDGKMDWNERPSLSRRSVDTTFGGPIEHMVDLANVSGKDLWINIPHLATDDYIRGLANYLKANLNTTSKVYLEWSNEVWNCGQFAQCQYAGTAGSALGLKPRWYTIKRVIDAGLIFRSIFGDASMMTRIRPVYADQFAAPGETADAIAWAYRTYPNLINYYIYGLAVAPYYGGGDASDSGTASQILDGMISGINGRLNAIMSIIDRGGTYPDFYSIARSYGIRLLAYEGGTDLGYSSINAVNKIAAQNSPGMKDRTLGYLGQWNACGGDLFNYFTFSWAMTGKFQWGLTDNVGSSASIQPKLAGAHQAASTDARYFECAPLNPAINSFSYNPIGVVGTGSGLTGTYYSDNNLSVIAKLKDNSPVIRIDPVLNFIWNNYGSADAYPRTDYNGAVHTFSAKWTGQIQPKFTGSYKFEMELDTGDSATVKINGQSVLGTTINLTAGTKHSIEITYQPNGNGGIARLWWSSTGGTNGNQIRAIVPRSQLYPN